jgi:hypothetical protein
VDDRQPYVFKTTDFGKSWTKIITGISDGHFARAIREDHQREGLLFLATEHGVYVSFDAGDHWQSLQLNLPDTPIRDLVVKNDDIVLGSHGRGFWILDDIGPLRQMSENMMKEAAVLFQPSDPIRGIYNAKIQYYLTEKVDSVRIDILDGDGGIVDSYIGTKESYKPDPNLPWWRRSGSTEPTTARGLNEFTWDLRYPGAKTFDGMIIWSAQPERGPMAPLGKYQVKLTVNDHVILKPFTLKIDPNLKDITAKDLDEQFKLASAIRDKTSETNQKVINIRQVKKEIEATTDAEIISAAKEFIAGLSSIEQELYQVKNQSNQDPLNFPIKLNNRFASLRRSVENGDARPTNGAYKVFEELKIELKGHIDQLNLLKATNIPKLNELMTKKGFKSLSEL